MKLTVAAARTASPSTRPVSEWIPEGTSSASTGAGEAFITRTVSAAAPETARVSPVPNRASTMTSGSFSGFPVTSRVGASPDRRTGVSDVSGSLRRASGRDQPRSARRRRRRLRVSRHVPDRGQARGFPEHAPVRGTGVARDARRVPDQG